MVYGALPDRMRCKSDESFAMEWTTSPDSAAVCHICRAAERTDVSLGKENPWKRLCNSTCVFPFFANASLRGWPHPPAANG